MIGTPRNKTSKNIYIVVALLALLTGAVLAAYYLDEPKQEQGNTQNGQPQSDSYTRTGKIKEMGKYYTDFTFEYQGPHPLDPTTAVTETRTVKIDSKTQVFRRTIVSGSLQTSPALWTDLRAGMEVVVTTKADLAAGGILPATQIEIVK